MLSLIRRVYETGFSRLHAMEYLQACLSGCDEDVLSKLRDRQGEEVQWSKQIAEGRKCMDCRHRIPDDWIADHPNAKRCAACCMVAIDNLLDNHELRTRDLND